MREFFRGWKRKVGCVTLVMACVFAVLWVRGFMAWEGFSIPGWENSNPIVSFQNEHEIHPIEGVTPNSLRAYVWSETRVLEIINIQHQWIVIPLLLLSAWLLISKPRAGKVATDSPDPLT